MTKQSVREMLLSFPWLKPDQQGIWLVEGAMIDYGENDVFTPQIGYFEGKYEDVIDFALENSKFLNVAEDSHGTVTLINVKPVNREMVEIVVNAKQKITELTKQTEDYQKIILSSF